MPNDDTSLPHDEISQRARELWESRGQPSGQDEAIWLEAEREVRGRSTPPQPPEIQRSAPSNAPTPSSSSSRRDTPAPSPLRSTSRGQRRESEG